MQHHIFHALRRHATKLAATPADAEDLVQETLLAGWLAGRTDVAFLLGVLRKQAAMAWRTAVRREARDSQSDAPLSLSTPVEACEATMPCDVAAWIAARPRGLRQLAVLALHGLNAGEIRWLLGLAPAAFRQRVAALRAAVAVAPMDLRIALQDLVRQPFSFRSSSVAMTSRRTLKASLMHESAMATHDPDGHVLRIRSGPHVSVPRGN